MKTTIPELIDLPRAAELLGLSQNRVRTLAHDGRIGRRVGRSFIFTSAEVHEFKRIPRKPGRPKSNTK